MGRRASFPPTTGAIDAIRHEERITPAGAKRTYPAPLDDLPEGCFIRLGSGPAAALVLGPALFAWTPLGYGPPTPRPGWSCRS